jgi:hypothetical protein
VRATLPIKSTPVVMPRSRIPPRCLGLYTAVT